MSTFTVPWLFKSIQMHEIFCISHLYGTQQLWSHFHLSPVAYEAYTRRTLDFWESTFFCTWHLASSFYSCDQVLVPERKTLCDLFSCHVLVSVLQAGGTSDVNLKCGSFTARGTFPVMFWGAEEQHVVFIKICHPLVVVQGERMFTLNILSYLTVTTSIMCSL